MRPQRETLRLVLCFMVVASIIALLSVSPGSAQASSSAYVRVNQVGYVTGETKQAILMATGSESGATFNVVDRASGKTVYSAPIGASQGKWSAAFPNTYLLDFSPVKAAGSYDIRVHGAIDARSSA